MWLIDLDELAKHEHWEKIVRDLSVAPTINPDDLRPQGRYRIDGHHIRFKCCDKVLSIVPNESDDYENLVSCPFCNAKMGGKENEE